LDFEERGRAGNVYKVIADVLIDLSLGAPSVRGAMTRNTQHKRKKKNAKKQ